MQYLKQASLRSLLIVPLALQLFGGGGLVGCLVGSGQGMIERVVVQEMADNDRRTQKLQVYREPLEWLNQAQGDAVRLGELTPPILKALNQHFSAQRPADRAGAVLGITALPNSDAAGWQKNGQIRSGLAFLALVGSAGLGALAATWMARSRRVRQTDRATRADPLSPESDDSNRPFQLAMQHSPDIFVLYDGDRRIQYVNAQGLQKTDWTLAQCIGKRDEDLLPPEITNAYLHLLQKTVDTKVLQSGECTFQLPGAETKTFIVKYVPLLNSRGGLDRICGIACDITSQKQTENALRVGEEQLRLLADSLPVLISYSDTEQRYQFVNKTYETFFGIDRDSIPGRHLREVVGEAYYGQVQGYVERVLTGETVRYEATMPGEQERSLSVILAPNVDESSQVKGFYVLAIDISERRQVERELQRSQEAAEVANRVKSAFLSSMSHELRTPLNAILGFAQLLLPEASLSPAQRSHVGTILRSGEHLLALINDVLEMSKLDAGRMSLNLEDVDLYWFLDDLMLMLRQKAEDKGLKFQLERATNLPRFIHTDGVKLRQILVKLLSNGIKFTQDGWVVLRAQVKPGTIATPGISLVFEVEDTGIGIADTELEHIFEPFVQSEVKSEVHQGTGLGLTLSRGYAQLLGGGITAGEGGDRGSLFRLEVKVLPGKAAPQATVPRHAIRLAFDQTCRVLVVEDHPDSRSLVMLLLSNFGFEVREASNGQEAIELWQSWSPQVILMDMQMPVLNGYETTRKIRSKEQTLTSAPVPIVALTASVFEEQQAEILAAGCNAIICKPFQVQMLYETIAKYSGCQLIYQDGLPNPQAKKETPVAIDLLPLRRSDLAVMSIAWRQELHNAAIRLFEQKCHELVAQIPTEQVHIRQQLDRIIQEFRFDRLIELTRESDG